MDIKKEYSEICQKYSKIYGNFDPFWLLALIQQESSGNPWVVRYEMKYQYILSTEYYSKLNRITENTELVCQKMSWGLGQIMGAVARDLGHQNLITELLNPDLNIRYMAMLIQNLLKKSTQPNDVFAMYNGGIGALSRVHGLYPNQSYVNAVGLHLQKLKV